jgi:hypothetical protein
MREYSLVRVFCQMCFPKSLAIPRPQSFTDSETFSLEDPSSNSYNAIAIVKYTLSLRILEHHTKRNANVATGPCKLYTPVVLQIFISTILQSNSSYTLL